MRFGFIADRGEPFVLHHLDIAAMHLVDFLVHRIGELVRARHGSDLRVTKRYRNRLSAIRTNSGGFFHRSAPPPTTIKLLVIIPPKPPPATRGAPPATHP